MEEVHRNSDLVEFGVDEYAEPAPKTTSKKKTKSEDSEKDSEE